MTWGHILLMVIGFAWGFYAGFGAGKESQHKEADDEGI